MYAIEFETDITDRFIEIKEYEKVANRHAKIIILVNEPLLEKQNKREDFIAGLLKNPRHILPNQKFLTRDEANER